MSLSSEKILAVVSNAVVALLISLGIIYNFQGKLEKANNFYIFALISMVAKHKESWS